MIRRQPGSGILSGETLHNAAMFGAGKPRIFYVKRRLYAGKPASPDGRLAANLAVSRQAKALRFKPGSTPNERITLAT